MQSRRNESESCELLINFEYNIQKLNFMLQYGISNKCYELEKMGIQFEDLSRYIFFPDI
jgi:hypothetical protein